MTHLLDTDIYSELLKGRNANVARRAAEYLSSNPRLEISVMTVVEVVKGWQRRGNSQRIDMFMAGLATVDVLSFT